MNVQQPTIIDTQYQSIDMLLGHLDRLEQAGDGFFNSLEKIGQGPPSLLTSQLVNMAQVVGQIREEAKTGSILNVPSSSPDPLFSELSEAMTRSITKSYPELLNSQALATWAQLSGSQTSALFAERLRVSANIQAALSVPPPEKLKLD